VRQEMPDGDLLRTVAPVATMQASDESLRQR